MKIVTVIPLKKGLWNSNLTYFTKEEIEAGDIVEIPLRNKKTLGLVVSTRDVTEAKGDIKDMQFDLKKIVSKKKSCVFSKEFLESAILANKYFASNRSNTIASVIPNFLKEEYDKVASFVKPEINEEEATERKNIQSEKLIFQAPTEERISFYKTLIRGAFAQKKSVFVVLPTEHGIENFYHSLSKGIENFSFSLHSGLGNKKNIETFKKILSSDHPVLIICTAYFLSIPRKDFGVVIVENESSNAYKIIPRPHFDLRILAEIFASKISAKFVLGDSLLRFETIARKEIDNIPSVQNLSFRIDFENKLKIIKRGNPLDNTFLGEKNITKEKFKVLTDDVVEEIKNAIKLKKNIFIFSLRKGLGTQTVCRDCNEILMCENCLAPIVLYTSRNEKKRMFACNRCHTEVDPESTCHRCGSWNLVSLGVGSDTVFEELKEIFSENKEIKIFKLDKESAKTTTSAEKMARDFEAQKGAILVGTEMAFFYLKEKISLSIVASFDSLWSIPNFKMSEKVIQILISIISKTQDKLIIQTKNEQDGAIMAIKNENLISFTREELEDRKRFGYPPYKRFIKIIHLGTKVEATEVKKFLLELFDGFSPEIFSGFIAKQQDKYVTNTLIKISPNQWSLPEISPSAYIEEDLLARLLSLPKEFEVIIDPEDLL